MRRYVQHLGGRLAPLDELANARGEVTAELAAVQQAVTDLLQGVDLGSDEGLDPAALGGLQGVVIRPSLLPSWEDGL
ncbi:hypothetical protein D3C78_1567940 [compost metagenome]